MIKRTIGYVLAAALLGGATRAHAVDLRNVLADYSITSWSPRDGLPSGTVWSIAQDPDGYLWVGSDSGLFRFDGFHFVPWDSAGGPSLPRLPVKALHFSSDGSLWVGFGGAGGVARIKDGQRRLYDAGDGLVPASVNALVEDSASVVWVANRFGLHQLIGDRWVTWAADRGGLPGGSVYSAYVDRQGELFICGARGVFRRSVDNDTFEEVEAFRDVSAPTTVETIRVPDNGVRAITSDRLGQTYVTDPLTGFRTLGSTRTRPREQGRGIQLLLDHLDNLWVATGGQGLWRVSQRNTAEPMVERATALSGLLGEGAFSLFEDRDHNVWAGTTDGLNRLTPHSVKQIVDIGVVAMVRTGLDGSVWVGTFDGLIRFPTAGANTLYLAGMRIRAVHVGEDGTVWIATDRHLSRLGPNDRSPAILSGSEEFRHVESIASHQGDVWFYDTERGLIRWDGHAFSSVSPPSAREATGTSAIYADRAGRIWLSRGISSVSVLTLPGTWETFGARDGLDAGTYNALYEDEGGVMWLGASKGLTKFSQGTFSTLHAGAGIPTDGVRAIVEDRSRALWLGVGSGLVRIPRESLADAFGPRVHPVEFSVYDKFDGLAGTPRRLGDRAATRSGDGRLWFVTGGGITVVDPTALRETASVPAATVEAVLVDGIKLSSQRPIHMPASTARVQIDYAALSLTSPLKTRFRYRLEGFDTDWVDAGTRRQAFFTNLSPKTYRFRVAANNGSGWSDTGAGLEFTIAPRFYQTAWFPVVCITGLMLSAGGLWRLHLLRVRREFGLLLGERIRLSREIHDTVLQTLVGILLQLDLLSGDLHGTPTTLEQRFGRLRRQVESAIRESRESIWRLRSATLEQTDLAVGLQKTGQDIVAGSGIDFEFRAHGAPKPCPPATTQQLLRIAQEAMTNATRHAHPNRIRMEVVYEAASVTLRIIDDGRGFDPTDSTFVAAGHCGLLTMRERAASVGGNYMLSSQLNRGTVVEATAPVPRTP